MPTTTEQRGAETLDMRELLKVLTAVKKGDFSVRMPLDNAGMGGRVADALNEVIELNERMAGELVRVARVVGKEGKISQRVSLGHAGGSWATCIDSVNSLVSDMAQPVTEMGRVIGAVAKGDLSQAMGLEVEGRALKGEFYSAARLVNTMAEQLGSFASEVTRVAREVGTEGKLGGQAEVKGVAGTWKDLTDSVNSMANNLTGQVRNIAEVTTAVASGDLSKKITVDVRGEFLQLKGTINTMVDQLRSFASEVTRVAGEVGTEGKLGGQAHVPGVGGTWKDLTDNVNLMAANLTNQMRNIVDVTTAVARGDLSRKITVDVKGEILELKDTINTMVDQLGSFASEVTRVAREVGTEGKLGGQAEVKGVAGTWKDLTDSVNLMAANLTGQVRNIADVTTAVARGDLSKKITVDVKGEILELKDTINTMVDQLRSFASEVTRVAREVGTDGRLGGQADVPGVGGTWKDLTDNVNLMAANLTGQVRNIADVTTAVARGDLSRKITVDVRGEILQLKNTINTMVDQLNGFASEVTRVAREVGTEGRLGGQAHVPGVAGTWKDLTDNVNSMANNLTGQVRNIADVTTAVARGDLSKKITVDVKGEILELKNTINTMVDQLNGFASEVTRVAREVGTEGRLGGQAHVPGVAGTWKDLTDNVNLMAANLTAQVRGIATIVTAVANGDLKRKLALEVKGEIATLADTINEMIGTLATFADQVTTVAREVGIEGKLGGQAKVPGAAGTWKDLTDNVNQLAANLTTQVRAIAEVATAVTQGDLTRSIAVEALGEVAELKDNINQMIANLKDTTRKNQEQDWLKTNLAKFTRMMQGQRDLETVSRMLLSEMAPLVQAQHGVFYIAETVDEGSVLKFLSSFAHKPLKSVSDQFEQGEGLVGQCAAEKRRIMVADVPGDYIRIRSGLGDARPASIVVQPVLFEGEVKAVFELASLHPFSENHLAFLDQLTESIGIVFNTIAATMRTESLLDRSQSLTQKLQSQQEQLQKTNEELAEKARLLAEQKTEVEQARLALEEKAEQLALTSKYKSQFLANMSHELRTPLNSLLILSKILSENADENLSSKQVEFASTIHSSGSDLLELINDILDLSKIESGTMAVDVGEVSFAEMRAFVERTFRQVASSKGLSFEISLDPALPPSLTTDAKRLQQVLRNLLSNALKFTEKGRVSLEVGIASEGWSPDHDGLNRAGAVLAFSVTDTGIGIPKDKHQIIFEAFQQADGTTSRKYGGTGLGLSISREITRMLGGQIRLHSRPGEGSVFTLYLPLTYQAPSKAKGKGAEGVAAALEASASAAADEEGRPLAGDELFPSMESELVDDRQNVRAGDQVLLIIEVDDAFARGLLNLAREKGFKGIVASRGDKALALARDFNPAAITLELGLPDADGWMVLDQLKHDPHTRHVPVQIISASSDWRRGLASGALACLPKPAATEELGRALDGLKGFLENRTRRLLVVEDDPVHRRSVTELVGGPGIAATAVGSGEEALSALRAGAFDCMVVDLGLEGMSGFQLLEKVKEEFGVAGPPVIVYTGKDLTREEESRLKRLARAVVIKDARSPERLLAETSLFLHTPRAEMPEPQRKMLERLQQADPDLKDRRALIIDDDVRNIFALTTVLERHQMQVVYAESGRSGIDLLESTPGIDVVLMDVMMPEMDGYEAMRAIRRNERLKELPIIAVTAKAMKGDREKCIEAGASDYITKPVDVERLLSLLRVWLYEKEPVA